MINYRLSTEAGQYVTEYTGSQYLGSAVETLLSFAMDFGMDGIQAGLDSSPSKPKDVLNNVENSKSIYRRNLDSLKNKFNDLKVRIDNDLVNIDALFFNSNNRLNPAYAGSYFENVNVQKSNVSIKKSFSFFDGEGIDNNTRSLRKTIAGTEYLMQNNDFIRVRPVDKTIVHNCIVIDDFKYTKKSRNLYNAERTYFEKQVVGDFVKKIAKENRNELLNLGLSDMDIDDMLNGNIPNGFQVHHKIPLDDGGTNDFDNLIFIDKYTHRVFTGYQNSIVRGLVEGDVRVVAWVIPEGNIYQ